MRILHAAILISCVVLPAGCRQAATQRPAVPAENAPVADTQSNESDSDFDRKVACFDASNAFRYDAVSPRDGVYEMKRSCYVLALETCVVEYVAPDGSATIFDMLTREPLVVYLNYPGLADEIELSDRLSRLPEKEHSTEASGEDMTPERREYERRAVQIFEACAR
jgi:hypothetical protein